MFRVKLMNPHSISPKRALWLGDSRVFPPLPRLVLKFEALTNMQLLTEVTKKVDQLSGWHSSPESFIHLCNGVAKDVLNKAGLQPYGLGVTGQLLLTEAWIGERHGSRQVG